MKYRLKIVSKAEPNADGRWIEVESAVSVLGRTWTHAERALRPLCPEDHFITCIVRSAAERT